MKKINVKYILIILILLFACDKKNIVEDENVYEEEINQAVIINETIEKINLNDIVDSNEREFLKQVDVINHIVGKSVFVSKEDYYKFRNLKVSILGDSIAECSLYSLNKYFSNLIANVQGGRDIRKVEMVFKDMLAKKKIGDIMIISLGTNARDGMDIKGLENVYKQLNGTPLIMLSVVLPYRGQERNRNRDIKKFVDSHENCYFADWQKIVKEHIEWFEDDKTHPNEIGGAVYAQLLFNTVVRIMKEKGY